MDTTEDAPDPISRLHQAVAIARTLAGDPTPTEIEETSVLQKLPRRLPKSTVEDFFERRTTVPARWAFDTLITCLRADKAEDWGTLYTAAQAERNRRKRNRRSGQARAIAPAATADGAGDAPRVGEPGADLAVLITPYAEDQQTRLPENPAATLVDPNPAPAARVVPEQAQPDSEPQGDLPPAKRHKRALLVVAAAATALAVAVGIAAIVRQDHQNLFEAPVDGRQVGVEDTLAQEIGVWSQPGTPYGCELDTCLPDARQVGSVMHGQMVKVLCVTTGQKLRNGVEGTSGYYEDDRWVQLASGQGMNGAGYISNVYFARDDLPADLPQCPR